MNSEQAREALAAFDKMMEEASGHMEEIDGKEVWWVKVPDKTFFSIEDTDVVKTIRALLEQAAAGGKIVMSEPEDEWERAVTTGPRKAWMDSDAPPEGEGWEPDYSRGRPNEAWDRFDYHEESYWKRPKGISAAGKEDTDGN